MTAVAAPLCWALLFFTCVAANQKNVTAESGQNVTLTCHALNNSIPIVFMNWSRSDLVGSYVLLYQNGHFVPDHQHPSFKNRVDLLDRQMKDGNVSLILKDVMRNDTGTYECRVFQRKTNPGMAALSKLELICTVNLSVTDPPGPTGGGSAGLIVGLIVPAVLLPVAAVVFFNRKKICPTQEPYQPPVELQPV